MHFYYQAFLQHQAHKPITKAFTYRSHKKAIMDFEQTYLTYKNLGQAKKFEQQPDYNRYNKEKAWFEKVKSKRTGEYNQAEDLIKRELVPIDWKPPNTDSKGKPVKYPIKHVSEIIRKRLLMVQNGCYQGRCGVD